MEVKEKMDSAVEKNTELEAEIARLKALLEE
jgi:hypothetical protein